MRTGFRRVRSRRSGHNLLAVGVYLSGSEVLAENATTFVDPQRGEVSLEYRSLAEDAGVDHTTRYVDQTDVRFLEETVEAISGLDPTGTLSVPTGLGVAMVVLLFATALFLFLKFGGTGSLLASDPSNSSTRKKRPKAWGLAAGETDAQDILAKVKSMTNQRAALILLLRHCLLQAADETATMFRRSDTEREALRRLPQTWRSIDDLRRLLHRSELVHYGGRRIDEIEFKLALSEGEKILRPVT